MPQLRNLTNALAIAAALLLLSAVSAQARVAVPLDPRGETAATFQIAPSPHSAVSPATQAHAAGWSSASVALVFGVIGATVGGAVMYGLTRQPRAHRPVHG
jgi:hypothetical protein